MILIDGYIMVPWNGQSRFTIEFTDDMDFVRFLPCDMSKNHLFNCCSYDSNFTQGSLYVTCNDVLVEAHQEFVQLVINRPMPDKGRRITYKPAHISFGQYESPVVIELSQG